MINSNQFCDQFEDPDHKEFSYAAKNLIYKYFCDNDFDLEIDAISLCTDYNEYTWDECLKEFIDLDLDDIDDDDDDAIQQMIKEYLDEETIVIGTTADSIVYACF